MRPLLDMDTIQIEITNACVHECSNCTRLVGHSEKPSFMSIDEFMTAVDSLVDFPKMVGMMGGEPLIHPRFDEMARYLQSRIPRERCGLWSTLPSGKEHLAPVIAEVFGSVLLNDHTHGDIHHCPVLVSPEDMDIDEFSKWYRIEHCWVQNSWSASVTPNGAFFCEIAGALDTVLQGPGGWDVREGWWKKTPKDYVAQMERYCSMCGAAFPLKARLDTEGIDDVTPSMLERLKRINSPKIRKGRYSIYTDGFMNEDYKINAFRRDNEYFRRIAIRYGLGLRPNSLGYLEPYLLETCDTEMVEEPGHGLITLFARAHDAMERGDFVEAATLYAECLKEFPHDVGLLFEYGSTLNHLERYEEAADVLRLALAQEPGNLECVPMLAFSLHNLKRFEEAHHYYSQAIRRGALDLIGTHAAGLYYSAGVAACETGRIDYARDCFSKTLEIDPGHITAGLTRTTTGIYMPLNVEEIFASRDRYCQELTEVAAMTKLDTPEHVEKAFAALGSTSTYFLAYQGENDRELQKIFGTFACEVMAAKYPFLKKIHCKPTVPRGKLKVGFVSDHFYNHSVWKIITSGWLEQLDRDQFSVYCYYTGEIKDHMTEQARALSERFVESRDMDELVETIRNDELDVLIYPGIGMDYNTQRLAALRLAHVQCVSWGHPVTTGMPTIDYFLSSELMEPDDGDLHYTEQLVRLPNLSVYCQPMEMPEFASGPELGVVRPDDVLFLCCQNPLKYLPRYDSIFPRIASQVPGARFVFINYSDALVKILKGRLEDAFRGLGLEADRHVIFAPKLGSADYNALNARVDIYLDSIGWSGGNTTLESLPHNKPIVTLPGRFMRGRHTAAILTMMGVRDTIAADVDDYVDIAVRLAKDKAWYALIAERVRLNKHKVYGDRECIMALERFLVKVCRHEVEASFEGVDEMFRP